MTTLEDRSALHREALENIPWLLTGRLDANIAGRVTAHIQECADCESELEMQRGVHEAMRTAPVIDRAPQASLAKLEARIAEMRHALPDMHESPPPSRVATGRSPHSRLRLWLLAQCAALILLTVFVGWMAVEHWATPRFTTATSGSLPQGAGIRVRLVMAPGMVLEQFEEWLATRGARIIDGPTPEHAWTIELPPLPDADLERTLSQWRQDSAVRMAEPLPQSRTP